METGLANNKIKLLVLAAFLVTIMIFGLCACESKHDLKTVKKQVERIKEGKKYKVIHNGEFQGFDWSITKEGILVLSGDGSAFTEDIWVTEGNSWFQYSDEIYGIYVHLKNVSSLSGLCIYLENVEYIDLSGLVDTLPIEMNAMFVGCTSLQEVNFSNLDTSKVTSFIALFSRCSSIKKIDLSSLNMDSANDISEMFNECHSLEEVIFPEEINSNQLEEAWAMFSGCKSLTKVDLSMFDKFVEDFNPNGMFFECEKLETVYFNQSWNHFLLKNLDVPDGVQVIYVKD